MKNLFFGLVATILFSVTGFANTTDAIHPTMKEVTTTVATILLETDNTITEYKFNSVEEFTQHSDSIIDSLNELVENGEECSITITMSVTVTAEASVGVAGGSVSTTVTGSVTTSCANAVAAGKKLKAQLLAMAQ
ncbi:conserved exported hypothetical protein [Flavobacterium sp. 9AF]|uniref:hypothetical protein n=1 Tax=Flavobacterium sp. 9AF TaxID=2653142 RepID=UPI0012F20BCF|nr:hypothetical protein [Flavobacterium sp. 9AF]VXB14256.1 conserved exported hypothetical protein [Flavobacterium sp. 9AF]